MSLNRKGFTLIEFLIYMAILVVLLTAVGGILMNVLEGGARARVNDSMSYNARFAMERINKGMRDAYEFDIQQDGERLVLDGDYVFEVNDEGFLIFTFPYEGDNITRYITTNMIEVTDLNFRDLSQSAEVATVRTQITLRFFNPFGLDQYELEKTFYNTTNFVIGD